MILKISSSYQGVSGIIVLHLARRVPSEMKITKTNPEHVLGRPGGMRGGAGVDMRGSEIYEEACLRIRHAGLLYETGGGFNRSAHSAGPVERESEQRDLGNGDKR